MENVPPNEADVSHSQISDKFKAICQRFEQCQDHAERARQHLIKEKSFTPIQCKRATRFLFDSDDDPIGDLYKLLKQKPLPLNIAVQSHNLSLTLQDFEKERSNLQAYIDGKDKRELIVSSIETIGKHFKQLIHLLGDNPELAVSPGQPASSPRSEMQTHSILHSETIIKSERSTAFASFDPELGVRRLYELFHNSPAQSSLKLKLLDARLQQNLQTKRMYGESPTTSAEWSEIMHSLIQLAEEELGLNFNDLCHPYPIQNATWTSDSESGLAQ